MKRVLTFMGSPRIKGNSRILAEQFNEGAKTKTDLIEVIYPYKISIDYCSGCLRCNLIKKCSNQRDDWTELSKKISEADILVFSSPVYFHHVTAPLKTIIDRFRSFVHVQITESGLNHTPWKKWEKDIVLLLSLGSSSDEDAQPIVDLFKYMTKMLGDNNRLHVIKAVRLAVTKQLILPEIDLRILYRKLKIPTELAKEDYEINFNRMKTAYEIGAKLAENKN